MSVDTLTAHMPYLRRFARALTGSQVTGDAFVEDALRALIEGNAPRGPARIMLYRSLLAQVNAVSPNLLDLKQSEAASRAERNLSLLTPMARQAFLLVAMEQFTIDDAAIILEITPEEVTTFLQEAVDDISDQLATNILIIEDEPLIAMDLELLVQSLGHRVETVVRTRREAVDAVVRNAPGLVLADIHLADGSSGLDAVNDILKAVSVPVIFITAYPERLLTGTKPEPTFLITKPYNHDAVRAVISQALFFGSLDA